MENGSALGGFRPTRTFPDRGNEVQDIRGWNAMAGKLVLAHAYFEKRLARDLFGPLRQQPPGHILKDICHLFTERFEGIEVVSEDLDTQIASHASDHFVGHASRSAG